MKKIFLMLAIPALVLASCTGTKGSKKETKTGTGMASMVCDNTFQNIMQQEIDVFEYCYPEESVIPFYVSEASALDSVLQLKSNLAVLTRELTPDQVKYLKERKKTARQQRICG